MPYVEEFKIESDEQGFELHILAEEYPITESGWLVLNCHALADQIHEQVNLIIGGWLAEAQSARHSVRVSREDLDAYEPNDPKRATLEILLDGKDEVFV